MGIMSMRECFTLLASKGFKIDKWRNQRGETPLHCAVEEGKMDMAEVLLDLDADINLINGKTQGPLRLAALNGHGEMVSLLLEHGATTHYALHEACMRGHAGVVRTLVEAGVDVEEVLSKITPARYCVRGSAGETSEHKKGKAEALTTILEAGGDVNNIFKGLNLLNEAAINDLGECIAVLVAKGLDPNTTSGPSQRTALHMACLRGCNEAVRELGRLGAELDKADANALSPLCFAVMQGHAECARTMIDLGASVAVENPSNFTLLHLAAARGDVKCAYLLVEAGAPRNALSVEGYSPLMTCMQPEVIQGVMAGSREGRTRVAKLLIEMGADVDLNVMQCVFESGMDDVIVESMNQLRRARKSEKASFSSIASTLMEHRDEVVCVRLVHRISGKQAKDVYKLNTQLLERLGERQGGASAASSGHPAPLLPATANVLSTLLDPAKRGFKDKQGGEASEAKDKGVKLEYDGSDFTPEGFAVVVEYLTMGHVDNSLIDKGWRQKPQDGSDDANDGGGDGDGDDDDGGVGGGASRKRKRVSGDSGSGDSSKGEVSVRKRGCLFDGEAAGKALEAARYFCLEGMEEEVKRLMDLYGFEYSEDGQAEL